MRNKLILSHAAVAALLLAAPAMAQEKGMKAGGETAAPPAHAQGAAPMQQPATPQAGEKTTPRAGGPQAEPKNAESRPDMKGSPKAAETQRDLKKGDQMGEKAGSHPGKASAADKEPAPGGKDAASPKSAAGAAEHGGANVSAKQKTELRTAATHVTAREVSNVNIRVSVGAPVPRTIVEYWEPVPAALIEIMPAWRSYRIVRYHGELLIIDPNTFEIVYVLTV